jgi:alkanesulfonate monooxygenase SsuD/methylene tetrahydromethanopterin reductase-like flavin-dependent oxidoreductase (luciferase family)
VINTWLFEFFHSLRDPVAAADPAKVQEHFRWYLDLWTQAEARGFDGIFFSEHHFGAGYSPSPNLLVANMAARTSRMRLGVLGSVTPYATPWRVAEEFAMLDQLTDGRFEAGIVSGIPPEMMLAGISMDVAGARHAAIADVVDQALQTGVMSHHGPEWNFDDLALFPPTQQSSVPLWTAARTQASAERAGARGWKVCSGFNSAEVIATMFDGYRKMAADAGHPTGPDRLGLRRMVTFIDGPDNKRLGMHAGKRSLLNVLTASVGPLPPFAALLDRPDEDMAMMSNDEFVSGTPDEVAAELIRQCRIVGASNMMITFSAIEPSELSVAHATFASEVLPTLHAASI